MNMKRSLVVFGLTVLGVCTLDAAQFLTQAEIRARLDELYMPLSDGSIRWAYRHVDRCYNPRDPSDADLDSDGDGLANLREYRLGRSPRVGARPAHPSLIRSATATTL